MINLKLFFSLIIIAMMFFISSVHAETSPTYEYRCKATRFSADELWDRLVGELSCPAVSINQTTPIIHYVQFRKTLNSQVTVTKVYQVKISYKASAAGGGVAATATPAPTSAAGGATVTLVPTATVTPVGVGATASDSSTNRCPNLGEATTLDVVPDCKINTKDGAVFLKGMRDHAGQ